MNKTSFLAFTIAITVLMGSYSHALQAIDNFKVNNISPYHDISLVITNPYDRNYVQEIATIAVGGDEYSGPIPFNHPFYLTIFAGSNPVGRLYEIAINPKKTKTIFLDYNHETKTLRPQQQTRKKFFSKDSNIKQSEIIPESKVKPKTLSEIMNHAKNAA